MSNKNYARRTVVKLYFKGADISKELSKYLLSLSFTDKEEDETDDISLSLDDREGKWIKDWLNTSKAVKTKTETVTTGGGEIKVGAIVKFKGGPVYISSMAAEPTVNRGASTCKCTIANHNAHPYHLISQDGQRVYGWCNASDVEGGQATTTTKTTVIKEKKAFKLFTFSNFYFPCFRIEGDRIFVLADTAQLIVSFYPIEAIDAFVMGLFKNRQLEVGDRKSRVRFEVFNLERQAEPEFTSRMFFKTLSPMFIEEQLPETRKAIHLSPGNPKFAELLHLNLLDKYRVFYGQEPDPSWPLTRLHLLSEPKPKTIVLKVGTPEETRMKGYTFRFELEGQPELLRLGYEGGFGRLNSQGFGCVEVLKQ